MDLQTFRRELAGLLKDVRRKASDPNHPYTKGYMDAIRYVLDWIDELD